MSDDRKTLKQMLKVDKKRPVEFPYCWMFTGEQGVGKSHNVGCAWPEYFYLQSRPTALANLEDWILKNQKDASKRGITLPKTRMTKNPMAGIVGKFEIYPWWCEFWNAWYEDGRAGKNELPGSVCDEENNFIDAIYNELKKSESDGFEVIRMTKEAAMLPLMAARQTGKGHIAIYHWDGISYVMDKEGKPTSTIAYPAGPATAVGTQKRELTQLFDGCWQLVALGSAGSMPRREIYTQPSTNEIRKPGFAKCPAKIPLDDTTDLRKILADLRSKSLVVAPENETTESNNTEKKE